MDRLLADTRRRVAIASLCDATGPLDLEELATDVAARSADVDASEDGVVQRVAASLHHVHLPILADADLVEYDPDAHLIEPNAERLGSFDF